MFLDRPRTLRSNHIDVKVTRNCYRGYQTPGTMNFPPINIPQQVMQCNQGCYWILYDLDTRLTEDDPPQGWGVHRSRAYKALSIDLLASGYTRGQLSKWINLNTTAVAAYTAMIDLSRLQPIAFFPTTLKGLSLLFQQHPALMNVQPLIALGGVHTPPNPINAIIPAGLIPVQFIPLYNPVNVPLPAGFHGQPNHYLAA